MSFRQGQRVKVEYEGTVQRVGYGSMHRVWVLPDGYSEARNENSIHVEHITPLGPANWPPQVGDIWEVDGEEYFARENRAYPHRVILEAAGKAFPACYSQSQFDGLKVQNPTLIRRRGQ